MATTVHRVRRPAALCRSEWPGSDRTRRLRRHANDADASQLRMPGIQKPRAELLPAGAAIFESVVTELGGRERLRGIAADLRT